jgi:hypothetical protein
MASQHAALDVFRAVNTAFEGERHQTDAKTGDEAFIASEWKGAKPGYAWKKGDQGLGYYLDPKSGKPDSAPASTSEAVVASKDANELLEVRILGLSPPYLSAPVRVEVRKLRVAASGMGAQLSTAGGAPVQAQLQHGGRTQGARAPADT